MVRSNVQATIKIWIFKPLTTTLLFINKKLMTYLKLTGNKRFNSQLMLYKIAKTYNILFLYDVFYAI